MPFQFMIFQLTMGLLGYNPIISQVRSVIYSGVIFFVFILIKAHRVSEICGLMFFINFGNLELVALQVFLLPIRFQLSFRYSSNTCVMEFFIMSFYIFHHFSLASVRKFSLICLPVHLAYSLLCLICC